MEEQKLVVIGAGIVGLSVAFYAARAGYQVAVIDPDEPTARASYGNAGVIANCEVLPLAMPGTLRKLPQMLLSPSSPLLIRWRYLPSLAPWILRFLGASRPATVTASSRALASILLHASDAHRELASHCGLASMLVKTGWLKAYQTERAFEQAREERERVIELGVETSDLGRDEIDELTPGARGLFRHATMYPTCEQVRTPGKYVEGLSRVCRSMGVQFVGGRAHSFDMGAGQVRAVKTDAGTVSGDVFVLAAGAWSRDLAKQAGVAVPLDTERGYHIMVEHSGSPLFHAPVLWSEKSIVLSQFDDAVRITSSVEFAGLKAPPRFEGIEKTLREVRAAIPTLRGEVSSKWLGFRPSIPDSLPVIGRSPSARNCYFAFGHGHLGLTLGPVTGRLIVQAMRNIRTDIDLQPFSPTRF